MKTFHIKRNAWDNIYGYHGTKKVAAFAETAGASMQQNAEAWLADKLANPDFVSRWDYPDAPKIAIEMYDVARLALASLKA